MRHHFYFKSDKIAIPTLLFSLVLSAPTALFAQGQWVCATPKAQFSVRTSHQAVAFDNKIWVLNGYGEDNGDKLTRFDNWYSTDGKDWTLATEKVPYPMHSRFAALVNEGYIWILGGHVGC